MKKMIYILIVTLLIACDNNPVKSTNEEVQSDITEDDTSNDNSSNNENIVESYRSNYVYTTINDDILILNNYEDESLNLQEEDTSEIIDISYIPTLGRVIKNSNGKYYWEKGDQTVEINLPVQDDILHIHQFSIFNGYMYYGINNSLYREPLVGFDSTLDGEIIVDGFIFNSAADVLVTNLHYIVDTDSKVRFWPGDNSDDLDGDGFIDRYFEYYAIDSTTFTRIGDEALQDTKVRENLHTTCYFVDVDGQMKNFQGDIINFDYIESDGTMGDGPTFDTIHTPKANLISSYSINGDYYGSAKSHYNIVNRWLSEPMKNSFYSLYSRDTMFREYWDHLLYDRFDLERQYLGVVFNVDDIFVTSFLFNGITLNEVGTGFSIDYEVISDTTYIPNMFVNSDGSIWIARGTNVTNYSGDGDVLLSYNFTERVDALTILPSGDLIVMDKNLNWYNSDGTIYTGDNIVKIYQ